ncbi:MAG: HAMP domain-containing protein [Chromatiaceae bacterium]|nr:HAMP domain-containing protein [Chromatiaceae bacterium]
MPIGLQRLSTRYARADGKRLIFRIAHNDAVIGYVSILVSDAREQALLDGVNARIEGASKRFEQSFVSIAGYSLVIVFFASLLIAWRLSSTLSRPLREMSHAAEQFAAGNLSHQLPERTSDELGRLADSLNRMARDLQKANQLLHRAQEIAAFGSWEWRPAQKVLQTSLPPNCRRRLAGGLRLRASFARPSSAKKSCFTFSRKCEQMTVVWLASRP